MPTRERRLQEETLRLAGGTTPDEMLDRGCKLHPSCLQCPRPRCRYDEPNPRVKRVLDYNHRARIIYAKIQAKQTDTQKTAIVAVMEEMSLSQNVVWHSLRMARKKLKEGEGHGRAQE